MKILMISIFGVLGVLARYFIDQIFPASIFFINMLGCFLVGVTFSLIQKRLLVDQNLESAILIGFLGGLTTFSSFSLDLFKHFFVSNNMLQGALYMILSPTVGLLLTAAGFFLTNKMV